MRHLIALGLVAVLAASCNGTTKPGPTAPGDPAGGIDTPAPGPAVNPLVGTWSGSAQLVTCSGPACWGGWQNPEPFQVVVVEQGAAFTALFSIDFYTVELNGVPQPDGSVRFSGSSRPPPSLAYRTVDVDAVEIRLDPESRLSGSFSYTVLWETESTRVTGRILGAKRRLPLPTDDCDSGDRGQSCFTGTWEGHFIIRSLDQCGGDCDSGEPGRDMRLQLTLLESDGVLSGSALVEGYLTVTGRGTRTGALLTGRGPTVSCAPPGYGDDVICSEVLEDLSLSLDQFGRLSGTLRYAREGWHGGSGGSSYYNIVATGDIWNLVRIK
jgi:hypothetical protein